MDIFEIISLILGVISTSIIPLIFALIRAKNNLTSAKNDVDREKSIVDMIDVVRQLIESAEHTYKEATGKEKKSAVLTNLREYADLKNYSFNAEYWGAVIDDFVTMTNNVNVNK